MSAEAEKEILNILKKAIAEEAMAENLYRRGVEIAMRPEVKDIFSKLADEEKKHAAILRDLYHDYKKTLGLKILNEDEKD
ncbi:MAG: hypothetical protein IEMM0002_0366 [bacterium]|nr:MAG: hypothetical protein IEMM0002_0366 [bacterium]